MAADLDDLAFLEEPAPWEIPSTGTVKSEGRAHEGDIFSHRNKFDSFAKDRFEHDKQKAARLKEKQGEKEQRRKDKATIKKEKGSTKRKSDDIEANGSLKKRRINAEDSAKLLALAGLSANGAINLNDSDEELPLASPVRKSRRNDRTKHILSPSKPRSRLTSSVTQSEGLDEDFEITGTASRPKSRQPTPPEEEEDSDPEIAAIMRKARENVKRKQELAKKASSPDTLDGSSHLPTPPIDPTIEVLISSPIPNTNPLIVRRKLSQNLQILRQVWCEKQGFDKALSATIFLTYCGRKLYDSTTVRRLGIAMDDFGNLYREDDPTKDGVNRVHVEAMTEEVYEQMKAEQTREARTANGESTVEEVAAAEEPQPEPARPLIKIVIQAKGQKESCKVKCSADTKVDKLIRYGKKSFGFAEDQNVYISFDEEQLDPNSAIGDTELEDMDVVEMRLTN